MVQQTPLSPEHGTLLSLPRPVPDWTGQVLEYLFLLGTTLWLGVHGSTALLTAPLLVRSAAPSLEATRLMIWLLENLTYAGTIAAVVLLLTTLGMHLTGLRSPRAVLLQLVLILLMTLAAVGPQLWILPKLSAILRAAAVAPEGQQPEVISVLTRATAGLGSMGLLHLLFGAILVSLAARRCYHYPQGQSCAGELGPQG
jgi:hypothetical protein